MKINLHIWDRGSGKTTALIDEWEKTGGIILVKTGIFRDSLIHKGLPKENVKSFGDIEKFLGSRDENIIYIDEYFLMVGGRPFINEYIAPYFEEIHIYSTINKTETPHIAKFWEWLLDPTIFKQKKADLIFRCEETLELMRDL